MELGLPVEPVLAFPPRLRSNDLPLELAPVLSPRAVVLLAPDRFPLELSFFFDLLAGLAPVSGRDFRDKGFREGCAAGLAAGSCEVACGSLSAGVESLGEKSRKRLISFASSRR